MHAYAFRRAERGDLDLLAGWLRAPHVARWWGDPARELALIEGDLDDPAMSPSIVTLDGVPFGYIQAWDPHAFGAYADQPAGTRGIDQFIGEAALTGKGHGPRFVAAFCGLLFAQGAPRIVTDPDPANTVAIRAYGKAGFRRVGDIETSDGPAVLMARDRA